MLNVSNVRMNSSAAAVAAPTVIASESTRKKPTTSTDAVPTNSAPFRREEKCVEMRMVRITAATLDSDRASTRGSAVLSSPSARIVFAPPTTSRIACARSPLIARSCA